MRSRSSDDALLSARQWEADHFEDVPVIIVACVRGRRPRFPAVNAAAFYGFDFDTLREIGDRVGPRVEDVAQPIAPEQYPSDSTCNAFEREPALKAW